MNDVLELAKRLRLIAEPSVATIVEEGVANLMLEAADSIERLHAREGRLVEALEFYADPETYFAISFLYDPPCGEFADDFEELSGELGHPDGSEWTKPGKRARAALRDEGTP